MGQDTTKIKRPWFPDALRLHFTCILSPGRPKFRNSPNPGSCELKEPLVSKGKRGDTEKRAKSQTLQESTAFKDVRGNWQDTESNVAPYFDSSGIWFSCLITTKEKKSRTAWRIFLKHSYFPLCKKSRWEHVSLHQLHLPPWGRGTLPSLWREHALTPKQCSSSAVGSVCKPSAFLRDARFSQH